MIWTGARWPSTWSRPFWESSSTTKIAASFQYLLCEISSTIRPTARSLSATSAPAVRLGLQRLELAAGLDRPADSPRTGSDAAGTPVDEGVVLGGVAALILARRGLGVLRVVRLHQPVVALGGVRADVVENVVEP